MTLNRSSSRIVIVIRSVAAIAASGAGHPPAAEQLTRPESGHFYVAKSGHFYLASTNHVIPGFRCPPSSHLKVSGFKVGLLCLFPRFE
ncbi:hypothetical protein, partial [Burkholderia anthina]|uniref:hypothetical protein n=1 Tax=Burkholderia anthina TaxID=179879 RepID=UPI001ABA0A36